MNQVQWSESRIKREFKRTTFTLDSAAYKELLDRITNGVTQIDNLLNANIALEPPRRRRSQWRLYKTLRDVTSSLFRAFRSAFVCQCLRSHVSIFSTKYLKKNLVVNRLRLHFEVPANTSIPDYRLCTEEAFGHSSTWIPGRRNSRTKSSGLRSRRHISGPASRQPVTYTA